MFGLSPWFLTQELLRLHDVRTLIIPIYRGGDRLAEEKWLAPVYTATWASLVAQRVKNPPAMRETLVWFLGWGYPLQYSWASLVAQMVKNPPAMQETWVQSMGWEDPLEEDMATHSSILAWKIPWTEEPDRLRVMGLQRVRWYWATELNWRGNGWWRNKLGIWD